MLRAPKITVITKEVYESTYWPQIQKALERIVEQPKEIVFSQEELYRHVYNVCCQRHQIALYSDLLNLMHKHLVVSYNHLQSTSDENFIATVSLFISSYIHAVEVISVIFKYLDRVYVSEKLGTSLSTLLLSALNNKVVNTPEIKSRLHVLLAMLPSNSDPSTVMNLVKGLYRLDQGYLNLNPQLFAMYIPCLQASRGAELDLEETKEIIQQLVMQGYSSHEPGRANKRKLGVAEST